MEYQSWHISVGTCFYGADYSYIDNREKLDFKSGRSVYYLKNSLPNRRITLNLMVNDSRYIGQTQKTEFQIFLDWYENTIKSGTIPFYLDNVVFKDKGPRLYIMAEPPTWSGQKEKELNLVLEEF